VAEQVDVSKILPQEDLMVLLVETGEEQEGLH
jgi:hypothetical protein